MFTPTEYANLDQARMSVATGIALQYGRAFSIIASRCTFNPDALLPGMDDVPAGRAAAAAEAQGAELTRQLLTPHASISRTSGAIERQSPLFRDYAANLQPSLF